MEHDKVDKLDEPIWGVSNFAKVINRTERQTYNMIATGKLPARKIGERYVSTRRKLLDAVVGEAAA